MSNGVTLPDELPKLTSSPSGFKQSSEARKVSFPTESYTTGTPTPPVISRTRFAMSSRVDTITCAHPWAFATAAFSSNLWVGGVMGVGGRPLEGQGILLEPFKELFLRRPRPRAARFCESVDPDEQLGFVRERWQTRRKA